MTSTLEICRLCGHAMKGVAHVTPDGREYNQLECTGPLRHVVPYYAKSEVMDFRHRVERLRGLSWATS
jgi:hypothetical protein